MAIVSQVSPLTVGQIRTLYSSVRSLNLTSSLSWPLTKRMSARPLALEAERLAAVLHPEETRGARDDEHEQHLHARIQCREREAPREPSPAQALEVLNRHRNAVEIHRGVVARSHLRATTPRVVRFANDLIRVVRV